MFEKARKTKAEDIQDAATHFMFKKCHLLVNCGMHFTPQVS